MVIKGGCGFHVWSPSDPLFKILCTGLDSNGFREGQCKLRTKRLNIIYGNTAIERTHTRTFRHLVGNLVYYNLLLRLPDEANLPLQKHGTEDLQTNTHLSKLEIDSSMQN